MRARGCFGQMNGLPPSTARGEGGHDVGLQFAARKSSARVGLLDFCLSFLLLPLLTGDEDQGSGRVGVQTRSLTA